MKKLFLVLALASLVLGAAFGFDFMNASPAVQDSNIFIDAGIGWGILEYSIKIPPISAAITYKPNGLPIPLSIGGYFAFTSYEEDVGVYNWSGTMLGFGARANWHFHLLDALDTYLGISLGWLVWNQESTWDLLGITYTTKYDNSTFLYGFVLGGRYFFTDNIGAYIELGYSAVSVASIGLALKF